MLQQLPLDETLIWWWNWESDLEMGEYCVTWAVTSLKHFEGVGIQVEAGTTTRSTKELNIQYSWSENYAKTLSCYLFSQFPVILGPSHFYNSVDLGDEYPHSSKWEKLLRDYLHESSHWSSTQGHSQQGPSKEVYISRKWCLASFWLFSVTWYSKVIRGLYSHELVT